MREEEEKRAKGVLHFVRELSILVEEGEQQLYKQLSHHKVEERARKKKSGG